MDPYLQRLEDSRLRATAVSLLKDATEKGTALHAEMHEWWAASQRAAEWVLSDDRHGIELVVRAPAPPIAKWHLRATDTVHGLRKSLDALAQAVAREFVPGTSLAFRTSIEQADWDKWSGRLILPPSVLERFREVQPFVTGRLDLDGLRRVDNLEKHEFVIRPSFLPAEVSENPTVRLAGLFGAAELTRGTLALEEVELTGEPVVIARQTYPRRIAAFNPHVTDYALSVWLTTPTPVLPPPWQTESTPTTDIRLLEALDRWRHAAAWAIAHITGQVDEATRTIHF